MRVLLLVGAVVLVGCSNSAAPFCGDSSCGGGESCATCAMDCGACPAGCGDRACTGGETCTSCPLDCGACPASCGDRACGAGETCSSCPSDCGMCSTSCSTTTCAGCCSGDTCLGGSSSTACGVGGAACLDCGPDAICMTGGCFLDPASRWNVVLENVSVSSTRYDGAAWDTIGGSPDLMVALSIGSASATPVVSGIANDTYAATFDGGATATNVREDALATYLGFGVYDDDSPAGPEAIGYCVYDAASGTGLVGPEFAGATQTLNCPVDAGTGNSGYTLTWHLERF